MSFATIQALLEQDFSQTNQLIHEQLKSTVPLISEIGHHIVDSGGKRIRPTLVLLSARALNYAGDKHIHLAAVIEFIHTSTLLHDDVVDVSELRRGKPTANVIWGNSAAVLGGDFLYSRTFQLLTQIGNLEAMTVLADITNQIAEGEMLQLLNCHNPDTTEADYRRVIDNKTAKLFEAACLIPAILANADAATRQAMATYGRHLGLAFQMIDDMMDYTVSAAEMGKNAGDDLNEGKTTLPLIYALQHAEKKDQDIIRHAIKAGDVSQLEQIKKIIAHCGALDYTVQCATQEANIAKAALKALRPSPYQEALITLCNEASTRKK